MFLLLLLFLWGFSSVFLGRHGAGPTPGCAAACFAHQHCSLWVKHKGVKTSVSAVCEFLWNTEASVGQEVVTWKRQVASALLHQFWSLPLRWVWQKLWKAVRVQRVCWLFLSFVCKETHSLPFLLLQKVGMSELTAWQMLGQRVRKRKCCGRNKAQIMHSRSPRENKWQRWRKHSHREPSCAEAVVNEQLRAPVFASEGGWLLLKYLNCRWALL